MNAALLLVSFCFSLGTNSISPCSAYLDPLRVVAYAHHPLKTKRARNETKAANNATKFNPEDPISTRILSSPEKGSPPLNIKFKLLLTGANKTATTSCTRKTFLWTFKHSPGETTCKVGSKNKLKCSGLLNLSGTANKDRYGNVLINGNWSLDLSPVIEEETEGQCATLQGARTWVQCAISYKTTRLNTERKTVSKPLEIRIKRGQFNPTLNSEVNDGVRRFTCEADEWQNIEWRVVKGAAEPVPFRTEERVVDYETYANQYLRFKSHEKLLIGKGCFKKQRLALDAVHMGREGNTEAEIYCVDTDTMLRSVRISILPKRERFPYAGVTLWAVALTHLMLFPASIWFLARLVKRIRHYAAIESERNNPKDMKRRKGRKRKRGKKRGRKMAKKTITAKKSKASKKGKDRMPKTKKRKEKQKKQKVAVVIEEEGSVEENTWTGRYAASIATATTATGNVR